MKTLNAIICCGLIGLAAGCGDGGSDDSSANSVSERTDVQQTASDSAAPDTVARDSALPDTVADDDQRDDRGATDAVDVNKAYDPLLLLVHLPTALEPEKGRVPAGYTGWVKDFRGDGAFSLRKFVSGEKNGPEAQFYNQATPMAAFHRVDGKIHGLYRFWDREGNLKSETRYEHGKQLAE